MHGARRERIREATVGALMQLRGHTEVMKVAFVCAGNAGRSQLATAFAERERDERGLDVEVVTGGTDPAESVHDEIREALAERGLDVGDRTPRAITSSDIEGAEYVITMGCSIEGVRPLDWEGEIRRWELDHPDAGDLESARRQRDEIEGRVVELFDDLERDDARSP